MDANKIFPVFTLAILMTLVDAFSAQICPHPYLQFSKDHSYCKAPNPNCAILQEGVEKYHINVIVQEHNYYRNKLATGNEIGFPTAANMLSMEWDPELAAVAQKRAEQCDFHHDCPNCREVQNFQVGQNLAMQQFTNVPFIPQPNWTFAVEVWHDEIPYFKRNWIEPFVVSESEPTYGHFTQLIWADSWRVGCGYVLYQEGRTFNLLYVCNYGPAGNVREGAAYKPGPVCSGCPMNACCGQMCDALFPGLCIIIDDKRPRYEVPGNYFYYCDFEQQSDCAVSISGQNKWKHNSIMTGDYLSVVHNAGERSAVQFQKPLKPPSTEFCFVIKYRTRPDIDGEPAVGSLSVTFTAGSNVFTQALPSTEGAISTFSISMHWGMETKVTIQTEVYTGSLYYEVRTVYAKPGGCD